MPVVQHLLHSLGQGNVFAKLDLAQAYQQLLVNEATAMVQTIVTHRELLNVNASTLGLAPPQASSLMERLLQGLPGVVLCFDDVLISAINQTELIRK